MEAVQQAADRRERFVMAMALVGAVSTLTHVLAWSVLSSFVAGLNPVGVALMVAGPVVSLAGFLVGERDERRQWPAVVCVITFFLTGASWAVLVGVSLINPAS
jgi:uncharacterized membrane protein